jgi:3-isopropylmalate/(R)-2-methylmalate dehydratase small subunit
LKAGLLTVQLDQDVVDRLWAAVAADPALEVTVDLDSRQVRWADQTMPFALDDYTRWRLMAGLDDIALTLRHADDIAAFESRRPSVLPVTQPAGTA